MKKITTLLLLAIFTMGSMSLFAGGDEWSAVQDAKQKKIDAEKAEKKDKDTKENKKNEQTDS